MAAKGCTLWRLWRGGGVLPCTLNRKGCTLWRRGGGVLPPPCACRVPSLRLRVRSVQKERAGALCPRLVRSACSVVRGQAKGKRLFLDLFNGLCNRPLRHAKIGCNSLVPLALHTQSQYLRLTVGQVKSCNGRFVVLYGLPVGGVVAVTVVPAKVGVLVQAVVNGFQARFRCPLCKV